MDKYQALKDILNKSSSIVVFTGAGMSVPSGIPDFRSSEGLYNKDFGYSVLPEQIISHTFYLCHTEEFYDFYKKHLVYPEAKPNAGHKYIADLEKKGKNVIVITQNIDGLHQKAGSSQVYELHGSVLRNYCEDCGKLFGAGYIMNSKGVPTCDKCGGRIKPDVVLYEENLDEEIMKRSISAIMTCDTLLIIGTSLTVYPAAGFIRYFRGNNLIVINKTETKYDNMCDLVFNEDVVDVFSKLK